MISVDGNAGGDLYRARLIDCRSSALRGINQRVAGSSLAGGALLLLPLSQWSSTPGIFIPPLHARLRLPLAEIDMVDQSYNI